MSILTLSIYNVGDPNFNIACGIEGCYSRVFSHVTLYLGKHRLTGNFFIECMIISDFTFVNKCLYMYYISINLSLNKLLNDI